MHLSKLINLLICPVCQNEHLVLVSKKISCQKCHHSYPVCKNIPIMLTDSLDNQELSQKEIFNHHYRKFSQVNYKLENWRLSMLNRIFNHSFTKSINTYLDIGCGATGYTVIEASKRGIPLSIGCDISLEAMIKAKNLAKLQKVSHNTAFVVSSAQNLPFKKKYFDYISLVSILEHLENDDLTIKSISSSLTPKGFLFICVPNTYRKIPIFLWPFYYHTDLKLGHKRHYSIEKLNDLLNKYKFKNITYVYNGHLLKFLQLFLDKIKANNDKRWWSIENNDINKNQSGVQLNTIYQKK